MTVGSMELPPEGMLLAGIALAGDEARGVATTHGLSLLFTAAGINVQGPQPGTERLLAWSGLESVACNEQTHLPDGTPAVVMQLTASGQTVRFLLPAGAVSAGQAAYLDQALPQWLARYGGGAGAAGTPGAVAQAPAAPAPQAPVAAEVAPLETEFTAPAEPAAGRKGRFGRKAKGGAEAGDLAGAAAGAAAAGGAAAGLEASPPTPGGFDVSGLTAPGGFAPSGDLPAPPGGPAGAGAGFPPMGDLVPGGAMPPGAAPPKSNRTRLIVLVVLLVIVVGGGIALLSSRNSGTTSPPASTTVRPSTANDGALAAKVNIVQSDLPSGWAPVTTATGPQVSSAYRQGAQQAMPAFASCLGVPATSMAGLFGTGSQSDATAHDSSPLFGAPGDPGTTIQSLTQVVSSAAQATSDFKIFAMPNFVTCFTQFQTAAYGAVTSGATVQIVPVTLPTKPGVSTYGYVSTVTLPGGTTEHLGNAFLAGGRVEAVLQPNTGGASFPVTVFHSVYGALLDNVAANQRS
ncbi:MAG: hypothetical protein M0Z62_01450 [Actinomycetota bacterium]|nr:hypothetical protein [Actinomycetota bacterium]